MVDKTRYIGLWMALLLLAPLVATAQVPGEPDLTPVEAPASVLELQGNEGVFTDTGCSSDASDGNTIGCWADRSGNGNDATASSLTGPDLATGVSGLNGQDALLFDRTTNSNTGEGLGPADTDDINTAMGGYAERTITLAIRTPGDVNTNRQVIYEEGDASHGFNVYLDGSGALVAAAWSDTWTGDHFSTSTSVSASTSYVVTLVFDEDGSNNLELFVDGSSSGTASDAGIGTMPTHSGDVGIGNVVGGTQFGASTEVTGDGNEGFDGHVAELQLFNDAIESAPRQILESALGELYGVSITNDRYTHSGYLNDITGLGQASDGTQQTTDTTGVLFFDATSLSGGDFALFGHNGNAESFSADTDPEDVSERLDRVWRLDQTNSPSFDLKFDVSSFTLGSGEKYQVLVDSDASFSSGASVVGGTVEGDTLTVTESALSNAGLSDGDYVTLAIAAQPKTPQNLTATVAGSQKVDLSWDAVSQNTNGDPATIDKYRIYRNNQNNPSGSSRGSGFSEATLIDSTTTGTTSFQATGLTSGSQYFFWVVAVNGVGESAEQVPPAASTPAPFGATGPGGVGATDGTGRLKIWLRGDQGVSTSGSDVNRWNDQSGYGHDFEVGTSPSTTTLNGREALSFNGSSQWLGSTSNLTTDNGNSGPPDDIPETNYTQFVVFNTTDSDGAMLAVTDPVDPTAGRHDREFGFLGGDLSNRLFQGGTEPGVSGANDGTARVGGVQVELGEGEAVLLDGSQAATGSKDESDFNYEAGMVIGGQASSSYGYYNGTIAEIVLYNGVLNKAEETIVQNYLATKYGASLAGSVDKYAYDGTYGNDLVGIGRASASANHLASTTSILEVSAGSFAGDGNYVFLGHDDGTVSSFGYESTEPINGKSANAERMEREWRADLSGTSSKTVTVSISGGDLPSKQAGYEYVLIVDSGDKFNSSPRAYTLKDGGGGSCEQADATCSASNVSLDDGDYVTVGAGKRVINFKNTTAQSFETAGDVTVTAEINLPYPASGSNVSLAFTNTGDLDGSGNFEDGQSDENPNSGSSGSNANGDFEADSGGGDDDGDSKEGSINGDYKVKSSSTSPVTLSAGTGSTTITLTLDNDGLEEQSEKFRVVVDGGTTTNAGAGADDKIIYTILDDDEPREIKFADPDYTDGTDSDPNGSPSSTEGTTGGFREETFTVSIRQDGGGETATSSTPCTSVGFAVDENSTATVGTADLSKSTNSTVDFKIKNGTDPGGTCPEYQTRSSATEGRLYFGGNNAEAKLTLKINEDDADDPDPETIMLNLSSPISAGLVNTSSPDSTTMTFQLNDDDAAPNVLFSSSSSNGDESTNGSISVTLDNVSAKEVTVDFAVNSSSSTAQQPGDFSIGTSSPLTFAADQEVDSKTIAVNVSDDSQNELDEDVVLDLSNPSNATLGGTTTHTYTINDNDPALVGASGPGGVGATDGTGKLNVWLEGDSVTTSGSKVTTWLDQSGYDHNFTQGTDSERPKTEVLNDRNVLSFDGSDDWLGSTNLAGGDIPETDYTQFLVFKTSDSDGAAVSVVDPVDPTAGQHDRNFGIQGSKFANRIFSNETISSSSDFNDGTVYVGAVQVEKGEGQLLRADGTQVVSGTKDESDFSTESGIVIGRHENSFGAFGGEIGEFVLFDRVLNDTRTTLIENHLAAKYGISLDTGNGATDVYAGDQSGNGNYDDGVFGVGRESTDDFHAKAGRDGLNLKNVSGLDENDDYLTLGHRVAVNTVNVSDISTSGNIGLEARLKRAWYTDLSNNTGDAIETDITVDLSEAGLEGPAGTAGNYVLLQRNADAPAGTDWTSIGGTPTTTGDAITFSNVTGLSDGTEITVGTTAPGTSPLDTGAIVVQGTAGADGIDQGWRYLGFPGRSGASTPPQAKDLRRADGAQFIDFSINMAYRNDGEPADGGGTNINGSSFDGSGFAPLSKNEDLALGRGFIVWLFDRLGYPLDPSITLQTPDGFDAVGASDVTVGDESPNATADPKLSTSDDLFLLANPYAEPFDLRDLYNTGAGNPDSDDFDKVVQIWEPDADDSGNDVSGRDDANVGSFVMRDRTTDNDGDQRIAPWQGFLLTRSGSNQTQITFNSAGRLTGSAGVPFVGSKSGSKQEVTEREIALEVVGRSSDSSVVSLDKAASVLFRAGASRGRDSYDAPKIAPMGDGAVLSPVAATAADTSLRAQESRPLPDRPVTVPLLFDGSGQASSVTLQAPEWRGVPSTWTVELVDTKGTATPTDDRVHVLRPEGPGYTFTPAGEKAAGATGAETKRAESRSAEEASAESVPRPTFRRVRWASGEATSPGAESPEPPTRTDTTAVRGKTGSGSAKGASAGPITRFQLKVTPGQALPVEMASFEVQASRDEAQLEWSTAAETNNAGFYVQHQRLGGVEDTTVAPGGWERLGFVEGAGTTSEPQSYRFDTGALTVGRHAFRLRQVDTDGSTHATDVKQVAVRLEEAFAVTPPHPNPARRQASLDVTVREAQRVTVQVYDILGRSVATVRRGALPAQETHAMPLPVHRLSSGTYFVRVEGEGFRVTRRMTVVR